MLKHFSSIKKIAGSPVPTINFNGIWRNELGSEMHLAVDPKGNVSGKYKTGVGTPGPAEEFDLVGFATGDSLSFTVNFGQYSSLTSWVGQHTLENGSEVIKMMWLLTSNVPDSDEPTNLWGAVLTGYNNFRR